MSEKVPYKRSTLFIQRVFQGRFIAWMLAIILAFAVCSAAILYIFLASDLESATREAHLRIADAWQQLGMSIILSNAVSAFFTGISVTIVVLYLSHKIAGPLYRFQNLFSQVGLGNLDISAKLRDEDQLQELAISFDEMLAALRQRRDRRLQALQQSRDILNKLRESAGDSPLSRELLADLERRLAALQEM